MSTKREEYVRVKRKNQTFFIHTAPSDTFARVKSEISLALGGGDVVSPQQMRLYAVAPAPAPAAKKGGDDEDMEGKAPPPVLLPDEAILADHGVRNDAVIYVTFAKGWESSKDVPEGDDGWEEIDVVSP